MARGVNKVILVGNLGKDPNTGQQQEKTEWHRVVAFGRLAEIMGEYLKKGSQVYIEGKIQTRKWQDQQGQDRYTTEVVANDLQMLGGRHDNEGGQGGQGQQGQQSRPQQQGGQQGGQPQQQGGGAPSNNFDGFDDDIPF